MLRLLLVATLPGAVWAGAARAQMPPPDPNAIYTFQLENDSILQNSDKYYTSGLRFAYTSPTGAVPQTLAELDQDIWGDGQQRFSIDLQQLLFTAADTQVNPPLPGDHPYAGVLTVDANLIHDTATARSIIGVSLGIIGPAALGEEVQNGFHGLIGQTTNKGWNSQVPTQPVLEVSAERIWRVPLTQVGPLEFDVLPQLGAAIGSYRTYALAGTEIRVGQGLQSDFGPSRPLGGMTGGDAYMNVRPVAWYLFAGGDGQAVAYDASLNGGLFPGGPRVTSVPFVGEITAGAAILAYGVRFAFVHVSQTPEFIGQRSGLFNFDGFTVSAKF